jgi:hypothetical protein
MGQNSQGKSLQFDIPNRHFAQEIVFHLQLFHLSVSDRSILAFKEILFNFVPWTDIFSPQGNFYSVNQLTRQNDKGVQM